jgi:hypothetical protein
MPSRRARQREAFEYTLANRRIGESFVSGDGLEVPARFAHPFHNLFQPLGVAEMAQCCFSARTEPGGRIISTEN